MIQKYFIYFFFFWTFFLVDLYAIAIRGRIYSRVKREGEANVKVLVFEEKKVVTTDAEGYFEVELSEPKEYTFRILRPTGIQEIKKKVSVDGELITLYTDKVETPKGAIQVEGQKDKTILSRYKVRYDEIKRMPGTLGEALNAIQTLPGIFAPPFFGGGGFPGGIVIRGASPNWNTILYDDLPIAYAFHLDTINSVIHNDLIKTIDIYTGAYPANYANATGGIIEIESTESVKKPSGQFSVSILMSQAMYQTPLFNGKGYFAAGGKIGYLDKSIGATGLVPEGIRLPQYYSSNVKFIYNFTPEHQISFTSIVASDNFALNAPERRENDPTKDTFAAIAGARASAGLGFSTLGLRYIWTPGTKFNNRITLINYDPYFKNNIKVGVIESQFIARAPYTGVRQDAYWEALDFLRIDFGTEYRVLGYNISGFGVQQRDPNNPSPNPYKTVDPDFERRDLTQKTITQYANAYTTFHFGYGNFKFEPGVRWDYIAYSKQGVLGPRGLVSYKLDSILKGSTFFAGGGDYYRYPFIEGAISKESGNPYIKFEQARKYGGGLEQQITEEWSIKGEIFRNEFSNLIIQDRYVSEFIGLNPDKSQLLTQPIVFNRPLNYSNNGTGWSRGYELFLKKSNRPGSKDWFGWISYTWSQTYRNKNTYVPFTEEDKTLRLSAEEQRIRALFPNTKEIIYDFDVTHLVNVVYGWRFSEEYQVGLRWLYRTAFPFTPVIGDDGGQFRNPANGQVFWNPKYSDNPFSAEYENSRRLSPYHRLDIRFDRFLNYEWGFMNFYVEIINLYMRKNVLDENFDTTKPFSKTNPSPQFDFFLLQTPSFIIPIFNVGLEVRF